MNKPLDPKIVKAIQSCHADHLLQLELMLLAVVREINQELIRISFFGTTPDEADRFLEQLWCRYACPFGTKPGFVKYNLQRLPKHAQVQGVQRCYKHKIAQLQRALSAVQKRSSHD